jgi:hypothetical protein
LPQGDIDDVFNCESVVGFQVDLSGIDVVFNELEEGVGLQWDTFLP